jgi:hypothetical protein
MFVEGIATRERPGDRLERSARVRWSGGELRLRIETPYDAATVEDDSWLLAFTLMTAMRRWDPVLEIEGTICARLLGAVAEIGTFLETWDPGLRLPEVRAAAGAPRLAAEGVGCFASRGVDSTFSAALARFDPLTALVHVVGLEPRHDSRVRAEEVRVAGQIAGALERPLIVVETNVRELTDRALAWHDVVGSILGGVGLSLSGALRRMIIPSSGSALYIGAYGSSPLTDRLWSTSAVEIEHDSLALTRVGKLSALVRQRPDLLPHLKVCWAENRPDNCGRCAKCVLTMCALQAAGALGAATGFPRELDIDLVRAQRPEVAHVRAQWAAIIASLGDAPADRGLRRAMEHALRRTRRAGGPDPAAGLDSRQHQRLLAFAAEGRNPFERIGAVGPAGHIRLTPA